MTSAVTSALEIGWTEAGLTVLVATVIYLVMIVLSRVFGPRQFASSTTYDLAFVFALGSLVGRVILVRVSLAGAVVGLVTMFALHSGVGWLHHHSAWAHRLLQNRPVLLAADGEVVTEGLSRARVSLPELYQGLRAAGHASLRGVRAVILERDGSLSVIGDDVALDADAVSEVVGAQRLTGAPAR